MSVSSEQIVEIIKEEIAIALDEKKKKRKKRKAKRKKRKKRKLTSKPSSETNLGDWFKRQGAPGKKGGWVDCNAPKYKKDKKVGYKSCGRTKGEKRSKYPACRPTAAACKKRSKSWGKKARRGKKG